MQQVLGAIPFIFPILKQCSRAPRSLPSKPLQPPAELILLLQDSPISLKVMTELGLMLYTG